MFDRELRRGHLSEFWDRVNKFGSFSGLTIARRERRQLQFTNGFRTLLDPRHRKDNRAIIIQNGGRSRSNTQTTQDEQTSIFNS